MVSSVWHFRKVVADSIVYLQDMKDFAAMNEAYIAVSRSTVGSEDY